MVRHAGCDRYVRPRAADGHDCRRSGADHRPHDLQDAEDHRTNAPSAADRHLADLHLADRHLHDPQSGDRHLHDRHLHDRHLHDRAGDRRRDDLPDADVRCQRRLVGHDADANRLGPHAHPLRVSRLIAAQRTSAHLRVAALSVADDRRLPHHCALGADCVRSLPAAHFGSRRHCAARRGADHLLT